MRPSSTLVAAALFACAAIPALPASPALAAGRTLTSDLPSALSVADVQTPHALTTGPALVGQAYEPGWVWDGGAWYWRLASGDYAIGWRLANGAWYYLGRDGAMRTGWQYIDGAWYLFDTSGVMRTGWHHADDTWYYFGDDGVMRTGWFWAGAWYYANDSGAMQRWWHFDGSGWYYLGPDGVMRTGWNFVDGAWYYFAEWGTMQTGWFFDGSGWYHAREGGEMQAGWQYIDGLWYYLGATGKMVSGTYNFDGLIFYFSNTGNLVNASTRTFDATGTSVSEMAYLNDSSEEYLEVGGYDWGNLLQFKDLSDPNPEGVTAAQIDDYIARNCTWAEASYGCTSSLRGCGQAFIDAAYWYGVNVVYLVSHAAIESAWGCSSLSRGTWWVDPDDPLDLGGYYYNYFGYGAFDTNPFNGGMSYARSQGWNTPAAGVWGGAKSISDGWIHNTSRTPQITIYEMRWDPLYTSRTGEMAWHQYATGDEFAIQIGNQIGIFYYQEHVEPVLDLVIPLYAG